jgi:hypothetical protein
MLVIVLEYIGGILLGVGLGVDLRTTQACLFIGRAISDFDSKKGLQDAVTPPSWANMGLVLYALIIGGVVFIFWVSGIIHGFVIIGILIIASILTSKLLPNPEAGIWIRLVYSSLVNRVADYAKKNDQMRSNAAQDLVSRIEDRLGQSIVDK